MQELWLAVPGFEGLYEASNLGFIRSLDRAVRGVSKAGNECLRRRRGRVLIPTRHPKGYLQVMFSVDSEITRFLVHQLIAMTFVPNPEMLDEVNHKDLNKTNNRSDNLEWITRKGNMLHASANGRFHHRGEQKGSAKLDDQKVREIRTLIASGGTNADIARLYGVSTAPISYIRTGKHWGHVI